LLARKTFSATTYKQKEIEGNHLPPMPGLFTKKYSVNSVTDRGGTQHDEVSV